MTRIFTDYHGRNSSSLVRRAGPSAAERRNCQYIDARAVLGAHDFDQHAAERRNCHIDQISYREARGLEINADHRADLEIDEQEENVSEARGLVRPCR